MRLFPNFFLWYFSTTKQYLFILTCTGRHDVPFPWNKIAHKHGRHGQNLQPGLHERIHFFKWKLEWYFAISYAIQNTFLAIFKKLQLWDRMSFSDFRSAVRSFIALRHFFTEFHRFLLVLSKDLRLVVKTTVLCSFPGCGGSPLTSITTAYYAVMPAWRNLLLVALLRSRDVPLRGSRVPLPFAVVLSDCRCRCSAVIQEKMPLCRCAAVVRLFYNFKRLLPATCWVSYRSKLLLQIAYSHSFH